jgi:hypothetical protein
MGRAGHIPRGMVRMRARLGAVPSFVIAQFIRLSSPPRSMLLLMRINGLSKVTSPIVL